ncbi:unnamed protein product [Periconia digitata]|uniref:Integrase zinc-binding domain-containing protein n=1 Tax=Periconia digitata TaxID=1303443 RepID=A0A9W4UG09_9PLEO|nr:unnamed protein product [Periconia digitata]
MDAIAGIVEIVHNNNGHAGWDTTWKKISSSYYGILRADVIFLLKKCHICANDARKRPKGSNNNISDFPLEESASLPFDDWFFTSDASWNEHRIIL